MYIERRPQQSTICELCAERQSAACAEPQMAGKQRLRILCLHGFRQTATQFRVRLQLVCLCPVRWEHLFP